MSGTKSGGRKAKETNIKRYGENYYKKIGSIGGKIGTTGGFAYKGADPIGAGSKGGSRSRRGLKFIRETPKFYVYIRKETGEEERYAK